MSLVLAVVHQMLTHCILMVTAIVSHAIPTHLEKMLLNTFIK
jgi:hypothetical protein